MPIPPYGIYSIGNCATENLLDLVQISQEQLIRIGTLPANYDFESHKELVSMQPRDVLITFGDIKHL